MTDVLHKNVNRIAEYLDKPSDEFTRQDLIKFITNNNIRMLKFRYIGDEGKLKTLNFIIHSKDQLDRLLAMGERVDGSSLLPYIDAGSSDIYVLPRYKTAYVNPFSEIPTIDILCSYYSKDGTPLDNSPEQIVKKAHRVLKERTGYTLEAMGELEYYVFHDKTQLYPATTQRGYQESSPFSKWEDLRCEALNTIAQAGGKIKYGHSEVGNICDEEKAQGMEQHEIEFLPVPIEDAADQLMIAKSMLRMIGYKHGVTISFAPKILAGHAGSGLHIHLRLVKDKQNMMIDGNALSDTAKKAIAGYLVLSPSLTAFGNSIPTSYLRLVPHQEAPTNICWGDRNRSVLVRVPLGWLNVKDMIKDANPQDSEATPEFMNNQTVEFRCPDGSADIHLLMAGLTVATKHGLELEDALSIAKKLYVDVNIFDSKHKDIQESLPQLPSSCFESADNLVKDRHIYEADGIFPAMVIDEVTHRLKSYGDQDLSERLYRREGEIKRLVQEYLHYS
jgi:glutamine synthetase